MPLFFWSVCFVCFFLSFLSKDFVNCGLDLAAFTKYSLCSGLCAELGCHFPFKRLLVQTILIVNIKALLHFIGKDGHGEGTRYLRLPVFCCLQTEKTFFFPFLVSWQQLASQA